MRAFQHSLTRCSQILKRGPQQATFVYGIDVLDHIAQIKAINHDKNSVIQ